MSRPWTLPRVQMAEPKQRAPFKSGVNDFDELHKRIREMGIRPVYGEKPAEPEPPKQHDDYYGCG